MNMAAMIGLDVGGALPPPVIEIVTDKQVIAAMVGLIVAALGAIAAGFIALGKMFLARVDSKITEMTTHTKETAEKVSEVRDQVSNTHEVNFRDDIDSFREEMRDTLARQDRKLDKSMGEIRRDIHGINERSLEEHKRLWDELGTKSDK